MTNRKNRFNLFKNDKFKLKLENFGELYKKKFFKGKINQICKRKTKERIPHIFQVLIP